MPDIQRVIEIVFGAVDRNTASTINAIEANLTAFDTGVQGVAQPLSNLTDNLLKAEAAVAALAAAYGGYAISQAAKFESAQIDLGKVLADGEPGVASFTQTVTDLSDQYGVSAVSILQGIANFKQAGFTAIESAELQKDALDLVIAGDVEAARASEILISALKGFGAEASSASRFIEALNNVSNAYATDINQLSEGMSRVAPILKIMGFSFEEGTGLLTPMIEVFRDGSIAADALKTGLVKLIDDSKPVTSALSSLGVAQFDLNGKMRSGKDIFYDVANAFTTLDENQKLVFASQLFGIEQAPKLVTVFNDIAKVNAITAAAMEVTGSVTKEVELRLASAEKQLDRFKTGFDNLARVLGGEILTQFSGIVGGATDIENAFKKAVEAGGLAPLFDALRPQMEEFEETLRTIARNLPEAFKDIDFSGLLSALEGLGLELRGSFGDIFGNVDLTTVEGLHQAIQTTVNVITSLVTTTKAIVDQFGPVFAAIGEAGQQIGGASDESAAAAGKLLGAASVLSHFGTALGAILLVLNETQSNVTNVFNTIVGGARIFTNVLQAAFDVLALSIVGAMEDVVFTIGNFLDAIGADETAKRFFDSGNELKLTADGIKANLASNSADILDAWGQLEKGLSGSSTSAAGNINKVGKAATDLTPAVAENTLVLNKATGAYEAAAAGAGLTADEFDKFAAKTFGASKAMAEVSTELFKVKEASADVVGVFDTLAEAESAVFAEMDKGYTTSITFEDGLYQLHSTQAVAAKSADELAGATKDAAEAASEGSKEWKTIQDVLLASQKQADDFSIKLGELSNKKYEIDVKAIVDLRTAELEANTQRISAAFQSTSDVVASLSKGVTDLWALFSDKAGFEGGDELAAAAFRMEDRLDRELELKREMTDAVVEKLRAESFRLNSGEPLISIDARELAPELELVFDKILKYTQVKATQQGLSLLVGL